MQTTDGRTLRFPLNTIQKYIKGDNIWIGARARIMPGVTLENRCVVAAGSVVTKDWQSGFLYGGCPARKIKEL